MALEMGSREAATYQHLSSLFLRETKDQNVCVCGGEGAAGERVRMDS